MREKLLEFHRSVPKEFSGRQRLLCDYLLSGFVTSLATVPSVLKTLSEYEFHQCKQFVDTYLMDTSSGGNELVDFVVGEWNSLRKRPVRLTDARRSRLATRLREHPDKATWAAVFANLRERPWLVKESWFNFDFFVRPNSCEKILDCWMDWKIKRENPGNSFVDTVFTDELNERLK